MNYSFDEHQSIEHVIPLDWKLSKNQKITFSHGRTVFNKDKSRIDKLAQEVRSRLGESMNSIEKADKSIAQVTTSSW